VKNRNQHNLGRSGLSSICTGLCTITFCAFTVGQVMAQNWSGASNANWNDSGNWVGGVVPVDGGILTFTGAPPSPNNVTNNDLVGLTTGNILFTNNGTAGLTTAFTLAGNAITLGGNITTTAPAVNLASISDTISLNIALSGTRTITTNFGNAQNHFLTISGVVSGGFGITKLGSSNLTLTGANTFSGDVTINTGAVEANVLAVSGTASSIGTGSNINLGGGILRFIGTTSPAANINRSITLTGTTAGGIIESSGTAPVTFDGTFVNAVAGAKIFTLSGGNGGANVLASNLVDSSAGGALSFTKSGSGGVWTLSGNNTYTGTTFLDNGTLRISSIADAGSSNLGNGSGLITFGASTRTGTLDYTGTGSTTSRQVKIGGFVGANGSGGATILASATSSGGTGLRFTNAAFNAAEVVVPATALTRTLTLGGANTDANEISGAIINGNAVVLTTVTKINAGLWILSGSNTYTGINTLTSGTLQVNQANNGLGNSTAANTVNLNGATATLSLRNNGAGSGGSITYGSTSNSSGYNVQLTASGSTINVGNLTANTDNTIALGALTQATNAIRTLNVTGANGYSLALASLSLSPNTGQATTLNPTSASITITGNVTNPMTGFGSTNFDTLTLGGTSTGNRIQGVISDAVGSSAVLGGFTRITKSGLSTWELTGTNTFSGLTTVSDGILLINGNSSGATGAATISGGTLGGTGSLGGAVTVATAGSLAPGNAGVGTLTLSSSLNVAAQAGITGTGKLNFELGTIAASDKVAVAGILEIGTDVLGFGDFTFSTLAGLQNGTYKLITGATSIIGTLDPTGLSGTLGAGPAQGTLQFTGNDLELVVTGVAATDPYTSWSGGAPFDGDANNDSVENGQAWFLGATTPSTNAIALLPKVSQAAGALVLEFDCLDATARGAGVFQIEYSNNLTAWAGTEVPGTVGTFTAGVVDFVVTDPDAPGGLLNVVATIPVAEAGAGKLFGRLNGVR
jgi:fibronectin-binding autotransporter adhesin